jgi:DNA-binding ferritin-like protein
MNHSLSFADDFPADARTTGHLVALLNQSTAETLDLAFQTQRAHRSVKGQNSDELRLVFEHLHHQLSTYVDDFENRALSLGGRALGTIRIHGALATDARHRPDAQASPVLLNDLVDSCGEYAGRMRKAIRTSNKLGHHDTAHFYTGVSWAMDKTLWMLTAHQEA